MKNNLENSIKDCIAKELEKGVVEKVISNELEGCIKTALKDMFGYYGDVTKVIEEKVKSVMIPYIENYDYSKYITKLDSVLVDVLKSTSLENKNIVENFGKLMTNSEIPKEIKLSEIFKAWSKYCVENVDKDDMDYDEAYINTSFSVEDVSNDWSDYKTLMVTFECEEDNDLKFEFSIDAWTKYDGEKYSSNYKKPCDLRTLRDLNDFEILLMRISEGYKNIIVDKKYDSDEIFVGDEA